MATVRCPSVALMIDLSVTPEQLELLTEALEGQAAAGELEASEEEFGELMDKLVDAAPQ